MGEEPACSSPTVAQPGTDGEASLHAPAPSSTNKLPVITLSGLLRGPLVRGIFFFCVFSLFLSSFPYKSLKCINSSNRNGDQEFAGWLATSPSS